MLPGIDLRLQTVLKALDEVVLPAIPTGQRLARDQAMLAIGHIRMIAGQWRHAARYEAGSLRAMVALATALLAAPGSGIEAHRRAMFDAVVARAVRCDPADLGQTEQLLGELGRLVDDVIIDAGRPGPLAPAILDAVLGYGETQALRERVWFSETRLDPDVGDLPDMATILSADGAAS